MDAKFKCKRCNCTGYDTQDGFYYCTECGLQADQILEGDEFGVGGGRGEKFKIKKKKKEKDESVTGK